MLMDAVFAERAGKLSEVLSYRSIERPSAPGAGEVEVRMLASTLNPSDAVTVSGAYGSRTQFPFVPGFEGVGVIERAGSSVPASAVGNRVLPLGSAGNWQQFKRVEYSWCVPVPDDIPDAVACFAYINPLTALSMVHRFCAGAVRNVGITAATSTIAGHLAELLEARGIYPFGLVRGTPGRAVITPSLWAAVIKTSDPAWQQRLGEATGTGGFDVIFDCVGGAEGESVMGMLRPGGILVHYGLLSGEPLPAGCFTSSDSKRVEMFRLRDTIHAYPRQELASLFTPVFDHLRAGRLHTQIAERVPLASLPDRFRQETRDGCGKLLITYDG